MLSSGFAQTLGDGIYLSHHSEKHEHLCDESHCRVKKIQTEQLVKMSPVESCPVMPMFPLFSPHRYIAIVHIPIPSSITQCSWRFDLASSLSSPCLLHHDRVFSFLNISAPIDWPKRTVILSQNTPLGTCLPIFTKYPLFERCLLLKQFCYMLFNISKGREGCGVGREEKDYQTLGQTRWWQKSLQENRLKASKLSFLWSKTFSLWVRVS